jgi:hypothetical protein
LKRPKVDTNRLFIQRPYKRIADLPCSLESGECVESDGQWVKITTKGSQKFYPANQYFRISKHTCYVGIKLPFIFRNCKTLILTSLVVVTIVLCPVNPDFSGSSGSASSYVPTSPESRTELGPKIHATGNPQFEATRIPELAASPSVSRTAGSKAPTDSRRRGESELDPMRCSPIPMQRMQSPLPEPRPASEPPLRRWYVCR